MALSLRQMGEFGLINHLRKSATLNRDVLVGIGDDAAVLKSSSSEYLLLATDMLVGGVHFTKKDLPRLIGRKALACNISDIAAMGGKPRAAVISLGVPSGTRTAFVKGIYSGINSLAGEYDVAIVGGDTVRSRDIVINVALSGSVRKKDLVRRSGAKPGDQIFVTGRLGGSLKSKRHLNFTPRLEEAGFLTRFYKPHAMIDVSDGLAADLGHILEESSVGAVLNSESVPLHRGACLDNALYDGEDFELIFTVSPVKAARMLKAARRRGYTFHFIGEIVPKGKGLRLKNSEGKFQRIPKKGFKHF